MSLFSWWPSNKSRKNRSASLAQQNRRNFLRNSRSLRMEQLEGRALLAGLTTDYLDYAPGQTVLLSASGYEVGEPVSFQVTSATAGPGQDPWTVSDGGEGDLDGVADGNVSTSWLCDPEGAYLGATLTATATGLISAESASTTFTDGDLNTTDSTGTEQNANVSYASKQDVYFILNEPTGNYTITVTSPSGTLLGSSSAPVSLGTGTIYHLWDLVTKASDSTTGYDTTDNPGGEYKVTVDNGLTGQNKTVRSDNFKVDLGGNEDTFSIVTIEGLKYNDHNGNGVQDVGDDGIEGWHFTIWVDSNGNGISDLEAFVDAGDLNGVYDLGETFTDTNGDLVWGFAEVHDVVTDINGAFVYSELVNDTVLAGSGAAYTIQEVNQANWVPTEGEDGYSGTLTADNASVVDAIFGNTYVSAENGKTIGFWSNKNGQALITADDITALNDANLKKADGTDAIFTTKASVKTFLLGATATNMANMLSAQLAGTILNFRHGNFGTSTAIYVDGALTSWSGNSQGTNLDDNLDTVSDLVNDYGFVDIQALITAANTELGLHSNTTSGTPDAGWRTYQEALKIAFDGMNNNLSIFTQ